MEETEEEKVDFFDIMKKAYETGINDGAITLQKLMEILKADLIKWKAE